MDFSGGVKHWDKCKLRTALEWVVFNLSRTVRLELTNAGSRINSRTTFPTHISKRVFMNEISSSAVLDIQLTLFWFVDSFLNPPVTLKPKLKSLPRSMSER